MGNVDHAGNRIADTKLRTESGFNSELAPVSVSNSTGITTKHLQHSLFENCL